LTCPPGIEGTVVDVQVFTRKGIDKDSRAIAVEQEHVDELNKDLEDEIRILREENRKKIIEILSGKKAERAVEDASGEVLIEKGGTLKGEKLELIADLDVLKDIRVADV